MHIRIILPILLGLPLVGCSSAPELSADAAGTRVRPSGNTLDPQRLASLPPEGQARVRAVEARTDMPDIAKSMEINKILAGH